VSEDHDPLAALGRQIAAQLAEQLGGAQLNPAVVTALAGDLRAVDEKVDAMGADVAQLSALGGALGKVSQTVEHLASVVETLEGTPPQALADWLTLGPEEADERWREIAYWIQHTLVPGYGVTRGLLPDCWPLHRPAMVTLSWMYATYRKAYAPRADPNLAAEWSTRWLRDGLDNISHPDRNRRPAAVIAEENCRPRPGAVGVHMMSVDKMRELEAAEREKGTAAPPTSEVSRLLAQAQAAAARADRADARRTGPGSDARRTGPGTDTLTQAAREQLASRKWWDAYWKKAVEKDVTWRKERAATEEDAAR
jgi:hypothetical protein